MWISARSIWLWAGLLRHRPRQVARSGYNLVVQGDAEVQRLLAMGRTLGLPTPQPAADGQARINLRISGAWTGFAAPSVTGTALLNSVHARVRGLSEPVEISSANISLTPDKAEVQKLTILAAGNTWRGTFMIPRRCDTPRACPIHFDLRADEIIDRSAGCGRGGSGKTAVVSLSVGAGATFVRAATFFGFSTRDRKTHRRKSSDSQPGREPRHCRSRTRSRPTADFKLARRHFGRAAQRRLDGGLQR